MEDLMAEARQKAVKSHTRRNLERTSQREGPNAAAMAALAADCPACPGKALRRLDCKKLIIPSVDSLAKLAQLHSSAKSIAETGLNSQHRLSLQTKQSEKLYNRFAYPGQAPPVFEQTISFWHNTAAGAKA